MVNGPCPGPDVLHGPFRTTYLLLRLCLVHGPFGATSYFVFVSYCNSISIGGRLLGGVYVVLRCIHRMLGGVIVGDEKQVQKTDGEELGCAFCWTIGQEEVSLVEFMYVVFIAC